jgi:hypothetical protein
MKKTIRIILLVFITIFFYTCSDNSIDNPIPQPGSFILSGTAENWIYGENVLLIATLSDTDYYFQNYVVDTALISNNGAFSLELGSVPDSLLFPVTFNLDSLCVSNVVINPTNIKSSQTLGLNLQSDSTNGYMIRSNYAVDSIIIPGQFFVYYLYLNQNVSITGSVICNYGYYSDTAIYNFIGVQGWNKIVINYESVTYNSYKYTVSNNEPAGGKWFPSIFNFDMLSNKSSVNRHIFRLDKICASCK